MVFGCGECSKGPRRTEHSDARRGTKAWENARSRRGKSQRGGHIAEADESVALQPSEDVEKSARIRRLTVRSCAWVGLRLCTAGYFWVSD